MVSIDLSANAAIHFLNGVTQFQVRRTSFTTYKNTQLKYLGHAKFR